MSTYIPLGSRVANQQNGLVALDSTGNNPGNWTVTFDSAAINVNVPYSEVYQISVTGAPGSTFTVSINGAQWNAANIGQLNSWDPNCPMLLRPGDTIYFFWSDPATDGLPPEVTLWLRYDSDIPANQGRQF